MPRPGPLAARVLKQAQPLWDVVRVDGVPPTTESALTAFISWVRLGGLLDALDRDWPPGTPIPPAGAPQAVRLRWHTGEVRPLRALLTVSASLPEHDRWLTGLGIRPPAWSDPTAAASLAALAEAAEAADDLDAALAPRAALVAALDTASRAPQAASVNDLLGAATAGDLTGYTRGHERRARLAHARVALAERDALAARVQVCAPVLHAAVTASPRDRRWPIRMAEFETAWAWASTAAWLAGQESLDVYAVQARIGELEARIRAEVEPLAALRAWRHAASPTRITGRVRADLQKYTYLVGQLGKGTGKYAAQQRGEIRAAMDDCRPAVPVWIMPLYRIAEQLSITADMFDVIVVDEASQAGVEATFLQYLAPKIVVIGDDRQVSPAGVGIDQQELRDLALQYLGDDRSRATWQNPSRSLFDEARERFRGMLTLTEHRRCVPEIIGFSNRIAYEPNGIRLVPVRQYGSDRLDPIRPVYLESGYTRGTTSQGKAIEKALLKCVPADEWAARRLRCGNAPDFQGSERDVVFLSMVTAPQEGRRINALTADTYIQRYNVAASRAKDQLWVFHSVPLSALGNPGDMRFALLDYCYGVARRSDDDGVPAAGTVPENDRVPPFDSLFEQRVFNRIVDRGYVVIPQLEVLGYSIDLVVVGGGARLAVECDGWMFFRLRDSELAVDRARALAPLWELLAEHEIHPSGYRRPVDDLPPRAPAPPAPIAAPPPVPARRPRLRRRSRPPPHRPPSHPRHRRSSR